MSKPELGTKRLCAGCNAKFYDLMKDPIVCPTCEAVFTVPKPAPPRGRRPIEPVAAPVPVAPVKAEDGEEALLDTDEDAKDGEDKDDGVVLLDDDEET